MYGRKTKPRRTIFFESWVLTEDLPLRGNLSMTLTYGRSEHTARRTWEGIGPGHSNIVAQNIRLDERTWYGIITERGTVHLVFFCYIFLGDYCFWQKKNWGNIFFGKFFFIVLGGWGEGGTPPATYTIPLAPADFLCHGWGYHPLHYFILCLAAGWGLSSGAVYCSAAVAAPSKISRL